MSRLRLILLAQASCAVFCACGTRQPAPLPPPTAPPANQLAVAGNACGPAALVNAFRFATLPWRSALDPLTGSTDRALMLDLIRWQGMKPSRHTPGRVRWSRQGLSVADLADIANDMAAYRLLPPIHHEVNFRRPGETPAILLKRTHRLLARSLSAGFPPILSVRRHIRETSAPGPPPQWLPTEAHFLTLIALSPVSTAKNSPEFYITCVDPWGGVTSHGTIRIPNNAIFPDASGLTSCLETVLPSADIGKSSTPAGESTLLSLSATIGRW